MAMKDWLHRLQPLQIYFILTLSIVYFLVQLFLSHITHALTLLVASYHMLCNIIALTGCIVTIKKSECSSVASSIERLPKKAASNGNFVEICDYQQNEVAHRHERSLRNTFGWTRIDILTMLIVCIFLAALCFSLLVEAVQTLIHIDHQDTMHHPLAVLIIGAVGLLLNGIAYLLIGGYTSHQCSFLHITPAGDVVLDHATSDKLRDSKRSFGKGKRELGSGNSIRALPPTTKSIESIQQQQRPQRVSQILSEMIRDICSSVFVIICAIIVYFANDSQFSKFSKFVDPAISIVSCICLLFLSYPYMKESCLILLQTIPGSIDIDLFKADLLRGFEAIVSVHDLHIWQLSHDKYVSTVHITFQTPNVYASIKDNLENFFHDQGITIVTIQPEFIPTEPSVQLSASSKCLFECQSVECAPKTCCSTDNLDSVVVDTDKKKKCKHKYLKNAIKGDQSKSTADKKCHSMLSLNVASLSNLAKLKGVSATELMKKSISESHVNGMSMNPSGRDGKRLSDASLTESCTSECDENDLCTTMVENNVQNEIDKGTVPEKYRENYAKKLEAEAKSKGDSRNEQSGLLKTDESSTTDAGGMLTKNTEPMVAVEEVAVEDVVDNKDTETTRI